MKHLIFRFLGNTLAVYATAALLPGITVRNFWSAALAALVIGALNAFVKPILNLLSMPFIIVTLGLFTLVINGLMLWLASILLDGFYVSGFLSAIIGALVISIFSMIFGRIFGVKN
ncbi:phage holin family protein [Ignavibacteria bacterium]|nr:phage holin family protein [Bacteroidota bacterium]MCZ2133447.1 phage holin family protein [Bacteroidota bacterium]